MLFCTGVPRAILRDLGADATCIGSFSLESDLKPPGPTLDAKLASPVLRGLGWDDC